DYVLERFDLLRNTVFSNLEFVGLEIENGNAVLHRVGINTDEIRAAPKCRSLLRGILWLVDLRPKHRTETAEREGPDETPRGLFRCVSHAALLSATWAPGF